MFLVIRGSAPALIASELAPPLASSSACPCPSIVMQAGCTDLWESDNDNSKPVRISTDLFSLLPRPLCAYEGDISVHGGMRSAEVTLIIDIDYSLILFILPSAVCRELQLKYNICII